MEREKLSGHALLQFGRRIEQKEKYGVAANLWATAGMTWNEALAIVEDAYDAADAEAIDDE